MKHIIFAILIISGFTCTNNPGYEEKHKTMQKGISPIISKDGSFIYVKLNVTPVSAKEIYADISYQNMSQEPILFYKTLLPLQDKLREQIFSIFDTEDWEVDIRYIGSKNKYFIKTAPHDDKGAIIPDLQPGNFIKILPNEILRFHINLSQFYDFSSININNHLAIALWNRLPAVSLNYKQVYEKDTIDNKLKPVYYDITLPYNKNIDSMRVYFTVPGSQ